MSEAGVTVSAMARVIFNTATTLNGYLADEDDSLSWLFAVEGAGDAEHAFSGFLAGIGVLVMGSTTYEWLVEHEDLEAHPGRWPYPALPAFVLSTRELPRIAGADVRFRRGDVADLWAEIDRSAGERAVWLVGGGDLVGQFDDAGLLDEVESGDADIRVLGGAVNNDRF